MNLKILEGPSAGEILEKLPALSRKRTFTLTFQVRAAGHRRRLPHLVITVKKARIKASHKGNVNFRFSGKTESGCGDPCKVSYHPLAKGKGIIAISG